MGGLEKDLRRYLGLPFFPSWLRRVNQPLTPDSGDASVHCAGLSRVVFPWPAGAKKGPGWTCSLVRREGFSCLAVKHLPLGREEWLLVLQKTWVKTGVLSSAGGLVLECPSLLARHNAWDTQWARRKMSSKAYGSKNMVPKQNQQRYFGIHFLSHSRSVGRWAGWGWANSCIPLMRHRWRETKMWLFESKPQIFVLFFGCGPMIADFEAFYAENWGSFQWLCWVSLDHSVGGTTLHMALAAGTNCLFDKIGLFALFDKCFEVCHFTSSTGGLGLLLWFYWRFRIGLAWLWFLQKYLGIFLLSFYQEAALDIRYFFWPPLRFLTRTYKIPLWSPLAGGAMGANVFAGTETWNSFLGA